VVRRKHAVVRRKHAVVRRKLTVVRRKHAVVDSISVDSNVTMNSRFSSFRLVSGIYISNHKAATFHARIS
jgi:hypothetical protein